MRMLRTTALMGVGLVMASLFACTKEESSRATGGPDLGCTDPTCGAGDASAQKPDAAAPRPDATAPVFDNDGATPPSNGDVFVPPFERDTGIDNGDASLSLFDVAPPFDALPPTPDSGVIVQPLPDTTVCPNSTTVAFRTDLLEAVDGDAGSGVPPASPAFRTAWHNAQVASGRPGPALVVLSNFGNLADGGTRRMRFGTPEGRLVGDSATDVIFSFERPSANPQNPANPFLGAFVAENTTRARGSVLGANGTATVLLRFSRADRTRYDIPVVGASLDAYMRAGLDGKCTGLDVVDLALAIPAAALTATLDGQPLSSLVGNAVAPDAGLPSFAIVHLNGFAPAASFEEVP